MAEIKLENAALVVIDMQKGIASSDRKLEPYDVKTVIKNVTALVEKFRSKNLSVFLVHVAGTDGKDMLNPITEEEQKWNRQMPPDWADFIDGIETGKEIVITKRQWGAFHGTELDLQLRRRKIDTVVLCGISTNIGVETTAREAYQHGYNQIFVVDAMSAMSKEEHDNSVKYIFPRIGLIRTTEQLLSMIK